MQCWDVDHDYVSTLGMEIAQGRNFSADFPSDSMAVIINESAAKYLGLQNPVGQKLETFAFEDGAFESKKYAALTVIGAKRVGGASQMLAKIESL